MLCRKIQELLSLYLDGELKPTRVAAVEKHLLDCGQCRKVLDDLRLILCEAENLAPAHLASDLWPSIEHSILTQPTISPVKRPRHTPLSGWRPRIAWALALAGTFLIVFSLLRDRFPSPGPDLAPAQDRAQILATAKSDIDLAQAHYQHSISALEQIIAHRAHEMDEDHTRLYREKLDHLENSIDDCTIALQKNSYNIGAQRALFDAYDRKISTLREMAVSASY